MCLQTERLQALLADNEKVNLSEIEPIPLPLEPQIRIRGIVPETATLFKVKETLPSPLINCYSKEASMLFKALVHSVTCVYLMTDYRFSLHVTSVLEHLEMLIFILSKIQFARLCPDSIKYQCDTSFVNLFFPPLCFRVL